MAKFYNSQNPSGAGYKAFIIPKVSTCRNNSLRPCSEFSMPLKIYLGCLAKALVLEYSLYYQNMMWLTSTVTHFLSDVSLGTSPNFSKGWCGPWESINITPFSVWNHIQTIMKRKTKEGLLPSKNFPSHLTDSGLNNCRDAWTLSYTGDL